MSTVRGSMTFIRTTSDHRCFPGHIMLNMILFFFSRNVQPYTGRAKEGGDICEGYPPTRVHQKLWLASPKRGLARSRLPFSMSWVQAMGDCILEPPPFLGTCISELDGGAVLLLPPPPPPLARVYAGNKHKGTTLGHHCLGSGSVARRVLWALEALKPGM